MGSGGELRFSCNLCLKYFCNWLYLLVLLKDSLHEKLHSFINSTYSLCITETLWKEVRRWTRNPLAWLHSTPEDSQPFTSLMVSQSAFLYLWDFWICLVEPVFHIPWDFYFLRTKILV